MYELESLDDLQLQQMFLRVARTNERVELGNRVRMDVSLEEKQRGLRYSDPAATHQRQADGYRAYRMTVIRRFEAEHQCSVYPRGAEYSDQERYDEYVLRTGDRQAIPPQFRSKQPEMSRTAEGRYARLGYIPGRRFFATANYPVQCDDAILAGR